MRAAWPHSDILSMRKPTAHDRSCKNRKAAKERAEKSKAKDTGWDRLEQVWTNLVGMKASMSKALEVAVRKPDMGEGRV